MNLGMLCFACLVLIASTVSSQSDNIPSNYVLITNKTISVPANIQWTNSSINVSKGDYLVISGYGRWRYDPRPQFETGPNGLANGDQLQLGALTGKISNNDYVFKIGSHWEGYIENEGWLLLGMYDTTDYSNNVGQMNVLIKVYSIDKNKNKDKNENPTYEQNTAEQVTKNKIAPKQSVSLEQQECIFTILLVVLTMYSYIISKPD